MHVSLVSCLAATCVALVAAFVPAGAQSTRDYPGRGAPQVAVPRTSEAIVLDAELREPAWESAARLTAFSQYQPVDQRDAVEPTEVRVLYAADAIYFAIIATSGDSGAVRATLSKRDNIANDDRVTIYLDTFNDRRRAFFFGANALGVQLDGVRTEGASSAGNMFGGSVDLNPDFRFETKGRLTRTGYLIEMRIPFKSLRFPSGAQQWGIQVVRNIPGRAAEDTWTDARRGASSFLAQSGLLVGIDKVERGVVTDLQPFVTEAIAGTRDPESGRLVHDGGTFDGGINARIAFTSLALDATINPDFSQVEADAGLVTVNERFTLFLPERRPFFLEGIELFATPSQLVYSRRIANPIAGAKLTGKLGRFGVAYLSAIDDRPGENSVFNVVRLRTDYGGNSVGGLTITDRRDGGSSNTVIAADTRYVFRNMYYAELQAGQSLTASRGGAVQSAPVWKAELDRTGRIYGFNYSFSGLGERFRTDAGFVPRVGYQMFHGFNRIALLGKPTSLVQNFTVYAGPSRLWRYGALSREAELEGQEQVGTFITLRGGWQLTPSVERSFFIIDRTVAAGVYTRDAAKALVPWDPSARLSNLWAASGTLTTPVYGKVNGSLSLERSQVPIFVEGTEGAQTRYSAALTVRATSSARVEATLTHSRISRGVGGSQYARVFIPRLKAEFQPTRALFFRVVSQFRSDRIDALREPTGRPLLDADGAPIAARDARSLRTDWLVQYEPSPGTIAFVGYGDTWGSPGSIVDTELRKQADGVFVKLAYLFRR